MTKASSSYGFGSLSRSDWENTKSTSDIEKATKAFMSASKDHLMIHLLII